MDMSLNSYPVHASIAVSDLPRARRFYEGTLGLSESSEEPDGSRIYSCGGGTSLHVYSSPANAGHTTSTMATWHVADLEQAVDRLSSSGVTFEHYDDPPLQTDEKGIQVIDGGRVAWFRDPDGNTFAIEE